MQLQLAGCQELLLACPALMQLRPAVMLQPFVRLGRAPRRKARLVRTQRAEDKSGCILFIRMERLLVGAQVPRILEALGALGTDVGPAGTVGGQVVSTAKIVYCQCVLFLFSMSLLFSAVYSICQTTLSEVRYSHYKFFF